jgi:hypothetical protein
MSAYDIHLDDKFGSLKLIDIEAAIRSCSIPTRGTRCRSESSTVPAPPSGRRS